MPQSVWARTPVRLMATAGLRLLPAQQAEDILASCREVLAASGFQFHSSWVELISGDMEGLYGWIAVNYATGALQVSAELLCSELTGSAVQLFGTAGLLLWHWVLSGCPVWSGTAVATAAVPLGDH